MPWYGGYSAFPDYVSIAARRARALKIVAELAGKAGGKTDGKAGGKTGGKTKGRSPAPVGPLDGKKITKTFWGKAWCDNLESYSDFASRLPRGRSYVRHGAVVDLSIAAGKITALVSGSALYEVTIAIQPLAPGRWKGIASECTGKIDSLVDLLRGNLSEQVMEVVTRRDRGLFPMPAHISLDCSCPDWAAMCKHVAAVLYGVGVRLDQQPDMLFTLRGVDHLDLIGNAADGGAMLGGRPTGKRKVLADADLSSMFGIEIDAGAPVKTAGAARRTKIPGKKAAKVPVVPAARAPLHPVRSAKDRAGASRTNPRKAKEATRRRAKKTRST
jgi:hypothetical protein